MAADNWDNIPLEKLVTLTVTGASANTQTTKWAGGEGTVAIYGTSGTSGFLSGTMAIQATPDETACGYSTIQSALGAVTSTGTAYYDFRLPKGFFLRGNMSGGTTNNNVTVQFFQNRATDERTA